IPTLSRAMSTEINDRVNNKGTLLSQEVSQDARAIFHAAVSAVYPPQMLRKSLQVSKDGSEVTVNGRNYSLKNNVHVVGFGKAVSGMARALEDLIGPHIVNGIISIPYGTKDLFMSIGKQDLYVREDSKIRVCEGATNNIPDKLAQTTAESILQLAKNLTDNDILVVLISGGGSSLLPSPIPPVTLDDLIQLTYVVQGAGGSIGELNTLRQNVEQLKGGGLARIAKPAKVLSLILSDVIEDKLDIISSGPTAPLYSSARQCLQVLERLGVKDKVPETIRTVLNQRALDRKSEQTMPQHQVPFEDQMSHVQNVIIGSNTIATEAAVMKAEAMGYVPVILTNNLQGEAREAADIFVQLAQYMMLAYGDHRGDQSVVLTETELRLIGRGLTKSDMRRLEFALTKAQNSRSAVCIISGGETTVQMTGNGKGGRSQEMALAFGIKLNQLMTDKGSSLKVYPNFHIEFLSAGTDGQDGPTDAAGAVVGKGFVAKAMEQGVDVTSFLANNDSYSLFKSLSQDDCLIHTGLTGTNVMDIQILIVKRIEV
ncbi:GLCTK-like protein, partial [Mya arenaria]